MARSDRKYKTNADRQRAYRERKNLVVSPAVPDTMFDSEYQEIIAAITDRAGELYNLVQHSINSWSSPEPEHVELQELLRRLTFFQD